MTKKIINEYDDTKKFLNKIRSLQEQISPEKEILNKERENKSNIPPDEDVSNWESPEEKAEREKEHLSDIKPGTEDDASSWQNSISKYWEDNPETESSDTPEQDGKDFAVINNVEVVINSTDEMDYELKDEEKTTISQLIDDFRAEVSEIAEFGKLQIYSDNAKLDGNVGEENIGFMLSAGDDNGMFLTNSAMLRFDNQTKEFIDKLNTFQVKFNDAMNEIIANRQQN